MVAPVPSSGGCFWDHASGASAGCRKKPAELGGRYYGDGCLSRVAGGLGYLNPPLQMSKEKKHHVTVKHILFHMWPCQPVQQQKT